MTDDDVFYRISTIMNVDPAEIAKIVHDYIERDIGCGTLYDRFNSPPPIYIGPVKIKTLKERLEEATMHADCEDCIKRDICTKDVPKPCKYRYTEEERIADQASGQYGAILHNTYLHPTFRKKKEDNKMKATSVQVINNIKDMSVTIEKSVLEETRIIISVSTDDDTYEFNCSGPGCETFLRKREFVPAKEYEFVYNKLMEREKELRQWKKEAVECLKLRDEAQKETYKLKLKKTNLPETPITDTMLVDDYNRLIEENKNLIKCKESLKSDLDLERAANEAQRKFIKEYAGNDTEVTFNYAIDSVSITYGLYDKDYIDGLRKKNNKLIAENAELKAKLCYKAKSADDIKKLKEQIKKDEEPSSRRDILHAAEKCVCGHREQDYGTPESNFQLIADLWNGYLGNVPRQEIKDFENKLGITHKHDTKLPWEITPLDVSMMMGLMKIARIKNGGGSGDSFVDLAGYAACGGEIWHSKKETNTDSN